MEARDRFELSFSESKSDVLPAERSGRNLALLQHREGDFAPVGGHAVKAHPRDDRDWECNALDRSNDWCSGPDRFYDRCAHRMILVH